MQPRARGGSTHVLRPSTRARDRPGKRCGGASRRSVLVLGRGTARGSDRPPGWLGRTMGAAPQPTTAHGDPLRLSEVWHWSPRAPGPTRNREYLPISRLAFVPHGSYGTDHRIVCRRSGPLHSYVRMAEGGSLFVCQGGAVHPTVGLAPGKRGAGCYPPVSVND